MPDSLANRCRVCSLTRIVVLTRRSLHIYRLLCLHRCQPARGGPRRAPGGTPARTPHPSPSHALSACSTSVWRSPCAAPEPAAPPPGPRSTHATPTASTAPASGPATYTHDSKRSTVSSERSAWSRGRSATRLPTLAGSSGCRPDAGRGRHLVSSDPRHEGSTVARSMTCRAAPPGRCAS